MPTKTIYIAAPFSSKTGNLNGEIDENYKKFLMNIDETIRKNNFNVILPHRDNNKWGEVTLSNEDISYNFINDIKNCDIVIAYPEKSRGVHIELGFALALEKKIFILSKHDQELSSLLIKLDVCKSTVQIKSFNNWEDLRQVLIDYLKGNIN